MTEPEMTTAVVLLVLSLLGLITAVVGAIVVLRPAPKITPPTEFRGLTPSVVYVDEPFTFTVPADGVVVVGFGDPERIEYAK